MTLKSTQQKSFTGVTTNRGSDGCVTKPGNWAIRTKPKSKLFAEQNDLTLDQKRGSVTTIQTETAPTIDQFNLDSLLSFESPMNSDGNLLMNNELVRGNKKRNIKTVIKQLDAESCDGLHLLKTIDDELEVGEDAEEFLAFKIVLN